jgi:hypothetical protein
MPTKRPTVFIGSSREALPIANAVADQLEKVAEVALWTNRSKFRKVGEYFLDSLVAASSNFDFAVMIFHVDDKREMRGNVAFVPRDNVIFELGLFMSRLGRERAFVLAPETWKANLGILSDLQGLTLVEFDLATPTRRPKAAKLPSPLPFTISRRIREASALIQEEIRRLGPRTTLPGPRGVTNVREPIEQLISRAQALGQPVHIRNIALDMESTWPLVREMLLSSPVTENITWQSLMIDSTESGIRKVSSDSVSISLARKIERDIQKYCYKQVTELRKRRIRFEVRAYDDLPTLHGFLFNQQTLFLSCCGIQGGRLKGSPNPYYRLDDARQSAADHAGNHFLTAFHQWFDHRWKKGRRIWPD